MSLKRSILTTVLVGTIAVLLSTVTVRAGTFTFGPDSIVGNTTLDGTQFQLVTTTVVGGVRFTISNFTVEGVDGSSDPIEIFIDRLYWNNEAGLLSGFDSSAVDSISGDDFTTDGVSPANLPGWREIGFNTDFAVQATVGGQFGSGIGAGESASFVFTLAGVATLDDVDAALSNGDLRVGIFVQGINYHYVIPDEDGEYNDSDSFVTTVPEPSTLILLLSSAGFLVGAARFRRKLK